MKCAKVDDVVLYFTGRLRAERGEDLEIHLAQCESCRRLLTDIETMAGRLAPDPGEFDDENLVGDVMTLVRLGQAKREKLAVYPNRPLVLRIAVPALAAAAVLGMTAVFFWSAVSEENPRVVDSSAVSPSREGFQARGDVRSVPGERVSFKIFKAGTGGYREASELIAADDSLAFTYDNRSERNYRYLMIVGADHKGEVFWYYPAHLHADENPKSIAIHQTEGAVQLPDEIEHDLMPGKLRIWALFSEDPLDVKSVEKSITEGFKRQQNIELLKHIGGYDIAQQSYLLEVAKR